MATFLNTTGVSYALEELIRGADERLVLISPFLRVNQRPDRGCAAAKQTVVLAPAFDDETAVRVGFFTRPSRGSSRRLRQRRVGDASDTMRRC